MIEGMIIIVPHGHVSPRPTLLVGTDCPCMTPEHLVAAANALVGGHDAVFLPAEDGGYGLIGLRSPAHSLLFAGVPWGTSGVMEETRQRLEAIQYSWAEPATLWDIDTPGDLARLMDWDQSRELYKLPDACPCLQTLRRASISL